MKARVTQKDPTPTHITEKDQILYTVYYNGIWILYLNKDKGVNSYRLFSETKNVGNGAILSGCHYNQDFTQCLCFF